MFWYPRTAGRVILCSCSKSFHYTDYRVTHSFGMRNIQKVALRMHVQNSAYQQHLEYIKRLFRNNHFIENIRELVQLHQLLFPYVFGNGYSLSFSSCFCYR